VEFTVAGDAAAEGYCHCASCRHWSASPVNAVTLWAPDAIEVTKGAGLVGSYSKSALSDRRYCKACGGHVFTVHPAWGLVDVYAAVIPDFPFQPKVHVNYESSVHRMRDDLPKFKDLPKEMGGSGETLAE
jgi:hypothetical protein